MNNGWTEKIARLQAEANRNMVKLSEARARIKDLEAELSDLKFYDQLAAHNWCRRAKEAEARIKELDQECAYMDALTGAKMEAEAKWAKAEQHIKEKMDEIAALKARIKELEGAIRMLTTFFPEGWVMPLGWEQMVAQAKQALKGGSNEAI